MGAVADVAGQGDLRASLEALRDRLAVAVDGCEARELASLAKQLSEVLRVLASLPGEEQSDLDDLAHRRRKRRASVSKRAGSKVIGGPGGS